MIKILAVVALLVIAQLIPSCGNGDEGRPGNQIIGWVDEKRHRVWEFNQYMVVINGQEYGMPYEFWLSVDVGDLIKFDGQKWSMVRKRGR